MLDDVHGEFSTAPPTPPTPSPGCPDEDPSPLAAAVSYAGTLFDVAVNGARASARAVFGGRESGHSDRVERALRVISDVIDAGLSGIVKCVFDEEGLYEVGATTEDRCRTFGQLASMIPVMDLAEEESSAQDSLGQLQVDLARQSGEDSGDGATAVKILTESIELYPNVGYMHVSLYSCTRSCTRATKECVRVAASFMLRAFLCVTVDGVYSCASG